MRYFSYIDDINSIFYKPPSSYNLASSKDVINHALGAVLYMSALRTNLLKDIIKNKILGSNTIVICLEDAVNSTNLCAAEQNVISLFNTIEKLQNRNKKFIDEKLPLIFIRVRDFDQLQKLLSSSDLGGLCGFIFPKINSKNCESYFKVLKQYNINKNKYLYGMPILESHEILFKENRLKELLLIKEILDIYKDIVLNIRIGGTDLSGLYGLRRDRDFTIYDINVVRDCICDIINIFKRDDYVISGPVYEYFHYDYPLQSHTFIKEILLDIANGLLGKTVIHPSQVNIVNSLLAVSRENYMDAKTILQSTSDGVIRSLYSNKMNEVKPHLKWALNINNRAKIMGVFKDGKCYKDILEESFKISDRSSNRNIIRYKRKQV